MTRLVAYVWRGQRRVIEKLTQCEECLGWFTVTVGIELVPGKPPLQLCVREFLLAMQPRAQNASAVTGDGGNPAPVVAGSAESLTSSAFVSEPRPVAATPAKPRRRRKA